MGNCLVSDGQKREEKKNIGSLSSPRATSGSKSVSSKNGTRSVLLSLKVPQNEKMTATDYVYRKVEGEILSSPHVKAFQYSELKNATRNFRLDSLIGEGGFGEVYKGWIDDQTLTAVKPGHGTVVAVKKLRPESFQGHKEWLSEVNYLGQVRHLNLVKLVGYCSDGDNRLLVYEYMARGSLENHLFRRGAQPLSWVLRVKVATGAARGLSCLHDSAQPIIYRDFKASNILLDSEFNAKLSDFGLAKAGPTGDHTHVSTQVMGTQGYAAPEYIATGRLTERCDVYSFGVVLLEMLTGRRAVDKSKVGGEQNLVDWAKPYLGDKRRLFRVMDIKLEGQYPLKAAHMVALLAMHCISEAKLRPRMSEVVAMLEGLPNSKQGSGSPRSEQHLASTPSRAPMTHNNHSSPNILPRESSLTSNSMILVFPEARC